MLPKELGLPVPFDPLVGYITPQFLDDLRISRTLGYAGYAIFLYDYLLTLPAEVQYIWGARWTTVKIVFLANRYGNLVLLGLSSAQIGGFWAMDSISFCFWATLGLSLGMWISYASINALVLLRAWILWGRRRAMLVGLCSAFLLYMALTIGLVIWGTVVGGYDAFVFRSYIGTCISGIPDWLWVMWIPPIVLETLAFICLMVAFRSHAREVTGCSPLQGVKRSSLMSTLYRDGILFYIANLSCNLFNMITWLVWPERPLNDVAFEMAFAIVSVSGQRLVLNLREIDSTRPDTTTRMASDINQQIAALDLRAGDAELNAAQEAPQIAFDVDESFNLREFNFGTRRSSMLSLQPYTSTRSSVMNG